MRTLGRKAFVLVAALDIAKGALAVVFAGLIIGQDYISLGESGMGLLFRTGYRRAGGYRRSYLADIR